MKLRLAFCGFLLSLPATVSADEPKKAIDFNRDIRPILSNNCFACHGPDAKNRESELRLDTRQGLLGESSNGKIVVASKPNDSQLIQRVLSKDPDERMPPVDSGKSLTKEQIELLRSWVRQGAEWNSHWAFSPLTRPRVPQIGKSDRGRNPLDHFVLSRLQKDGIEPSPQADAVTLVRRLSFDLLGLPPNSEQVVQFRRAPTEAAYRTLVDEMLKSPHFGERMAVFWLDLVRYADTVGYHGDQDHAISPYRDYVIRAFNNNMPFDRFTLEQLAGDLLPAATIDQRIATGYNRVLQTSHEGGVQRKEYLAKYSADRVRNVSSVWLGITLGCAECHDHKFDPFTQRDFYSLAAFFADVDDNQTFSGSNSLPTKRLPEMSVLQPSERRQLAVLETAAGKLAEKLKAAKSAEPAQPKVIARWEKAIQANAKKIQEIQSRRRRTMVTKSISPRPIRILNRGDWMDTTGDIVGPAVPASLGKVNAKGRPSRLDLAKWLTKRNNPLPARVFVNRLWKIFFGSGISKQLDDLGAQGESPVHPQLLDWLAAEFVDSGWDVKHVIRLMVLSQTYRQSSAERAELARRDPENRLLARQARYRIDAEFVRDNILSVSGLLVRRIGGPSSRPYQPPGYYQHLNFPKRKYRHDRDDNQYRRGVYMHWQRVFLHPMLKAFDAPSREECTAERPRSNTPLAALVLLNDPSMVEAARHFAVRIIRDGGRRSDARVRWAWQRALSRKPTQAELSLIRALLKADLAEYKRHPEEAKKVLAVGITDVPADLDPAELAAWTSVARAIFNLHELITRN